MVICIMQSCIQFWNIVSWNELGDLENAVHESDKFWIVAANEFFSSASYNIALEKNYLGVHVQSHNAINCAWVDTP